MKFQRLIKFFCLGLILMNLSLNAQTVTNTFNFTNVVQGITTFGPKFVPVVSSLPIAYTNVPSWVGTYIDQQLLSVGSFVTTNVIKNSVVLYGEPVKHPKNLYQGTTPEWPGTYVCSLANAKVRVKAGDRLWVILSGSSTNISGIPTNAVANWMILKIVQIPLAEP